MNISDDEKYAKYIELHLNRQIHITFILFH